MKARKVSILIALYLLLLTAIEFWVPYWFKAKCLFPLGKDAHWHIENLKIVYDIVAGKPGASLKDMFSQRFFYPPMVYFISLPFCLIAGQVSFATALIPYFAIWLLINLGLYLLGKQVGGIWAGILAPLIFLGYKPITQILGVYNLQAPLCAWLPLLLLTLFRSKGFLKTRWTLTFFVLLALSFLTYLWVIQFMIFPALTAWILWGRPYRKSLANILLGSALSLALVSPYIMGHGVWQWLMHHFPGLLMIGKSTVEAWSGFFLEGNLFYVLKLFGEPLSWVFLAALIFLPFKDKRILVLIAGFAGGFLILHIFKNMYEERMVPLFLFSSVLLAVGIIRSARWIRGAMIFVVLTSICITIYNFGVVQLGEDIDYSYHEFTTLYALEDDCRKNPGTVYVWRFLLADSISVGLWLMPEPLDCLSEAMDPTQDDQLLASDPNKRLVVIGTVWWEDFCPRMAGRPPDPYNRWLMHLCSNRHKLKQLYSDWHFVVFEVPGDTRLEFNPP